MSATPLSCLSSTMPMNNLHTTRGAQIIYLSHGGGPLPLLGDPSHDKMITFMQTLPQRLHRPEAIVVFSAHWEEESATIQGGDSPTLMYDYYGFPEESYHLRYPAKGNPPLAQRIAALFKQAGIPHKIDSERPYDHGSYVPLLLMYPQADIPLLQVSLLHSLDARQHLALGAALSPLMKENILFIGSGFSYHNMQGFDFSGSDRSDPDNDRFQEWLAAICTGPMPHQQQLEELANWQQAPHARYCHPREEHLLPLHVCAGIAGRKAETVFDDYIIGKRAVAFFWR